MKNDPEQHSLPDHPPEWAIPEAPLSPHQTLWSNEPRDRGGEDTLASAWKRLFGTELNDEATWAKWDGGDAFATLYSRGRVAWCTCDGDLIAQVPKELLTP